MCTPKMVGTKVYSSNFKSSTKRIGEEGFGYMVKRLAS